MTVDEYAGLFSEDPFEIMPPRADFEEGFELERRPLVHHRPIKEDDDASFKSTDL